MAKQEFEPTTTNAEAGRRRPVGARWLRKPIVSLGLVAAVAVGGALNASALSGSRIFAGFNDPGLSGLSIKLPLAPLSILEKTPATTEPEPPASKQSSRILWGFEAQAAVGVPSQLHTYDINTGWTGQSCPPPTVPPYQNGRGLAFDPRDGNLYYTVVSDPAGGFSGDHLIHKTSPPSSRNPCANLGALRYDEQIQDDLGALDVDPDSKHIWAAGYKPRCNGAVDPLTGTCTGTAQSWFYLINKNNGELLKSCWTQFRDGGIGNDTLTIGKFSGIANTSGKFLMSDAGEDVTNPNTVGVFEVTDCHGGQQIFPRYEIQKGNRGGGVTGIEYEWPGLITADGQPDVSGKIWVGGTFPDFTPDHAISSNPATVLEDISLCGFRARFQQSSLTSTAPSGDLCPFQRPDEENCDNGRHTQGEGDEESDDKQHHGHFSHESCNSDRSKDHSDYDSNDDNVHFKSTKTESTTYDPTTQTATTTGMGTLNGTEVMTYVITSTDFGNPLVPNVYTITLGNGYVHKGSVTLGMLTIN